MPKIKHKRFQEIAQFDHVTEWTDYPHGQGFNKAVWFESFFPGSDKLTLELACGKAEYTVGLAERYPDRNFIGVDIKGNRMWVGANYSLTHQLKNTAFLRTMSYVIKQKGRSLIYWRYMGTFRFFVNSTRTIDSVNNS